MTPRYNVATEVTVKIRVRSMIECDTDRTLGDLKCHAEETAEQQIRHALAGTDCEITGTAIFRELALRPETGVIDSLLSKD